MRLNSLLGTIFQIIIHSIMKGLCEGGHALTFKIHKSVNPFYFSEKQIVGLTEAYRAYEIFICKCIHIKPSFLRYSCTCLST